MTASRMPYRPQPSHDVLTDRLLLSEPTEADIDALLTLHADPRVWEHRPASRYTSRIQAEKLVSRSVDRFAKDGLGYWVVRKIGESDVLGWGGCALPRGRPWWNLTYRLTPQVWGRGYATEIAAAAIDAAHRVRPETPVLAFVMAGNVRSVRVLAHVGLSLYWRGPDRTNPTLTRLIYLDREPNQGLEHALARHMMTPLGTGGESIPPSSG